MEWDECARRGAIGAIGAVPGTMLAHPADLVKIRQQCTGASLADSMRSISAAGLYRGVGAGIAQKFATRGPMFLAAEASTQLVEAATGMSRECAVWIGSFCSGYVTGLFAAPAEWAKVQQGMATARTVSLRHSILGAGARHRLHGAGLRNALFDSTFFATEHAAATHGAPPALSFGGAAALAVVVDFPLDATVKRSMAAPPGASVRPPLVAMWALLREHRFGVFLGLGAKAAEFATSYAVTGQCSPYISSWLAGAKPPPKSR